MKFMSDVAIRIEGLSKRYQIGEDQGPYKTLRDALANAATAPLRALRAAPRLSHSRGHHGQNTIWALKDIGFEVKRGEVVGIIGRNGAGKSTLLKILSRITEPTCGYADIHGRVGSLLEVGTGFHGELTGRENIYLNGAILGMKRVEITRKFDEIVAFSEIEKFIDTPVKHYSTGMYLRLAFAVAAHLEPEILLVDEVLAVGDAAFRRKCLGKIQEVGKYGRTVLFVSHDMTAISQLASHSVLLKNGTVDYIGPSHEAIRLYTIQQQSREDLLDARNDRAGDGVIRMEFIKFYDEQGRLVSSIRSGDPVTMAIGLKSELQSVNLEGVHLEARITDTLGHPIATFSTRFSDPQVRGIPDNAGVFHCHVPNFLLAEETYFVDLWLAYRGGLADYVMRAGSLMVLPSNYFGTGHEPIKRKHGAALIKHEWSLEANASTLATQIQRTAAVASD
jgi:lipopolysaccharide transport system ATP-binding protein